MKSMLADIRKGEAEFAEGVNPELKKTIENAIGKLMLNLCFEATTSTMCVTDLD